MVVGYRSGMPTSDAPLLTPSEIRKIAASWPSSLPLLIGEIQKQAAAAERVRNWEPVAGKVVMYPHGPGVSFWLRLGDSMSHAILRQRDDAGLLFVLSRLTRGGTFLDIGANFGWFALRAAQVYKQLGDGKVHAFEPQAEVAECLASAVRTNEFGAIVTLHQMALGDQQTKVWMRPPGNNSGGSHVMFKRAAGAAVEMRQLDSLDLGIGRLDIIKLDIEGAEPMFMAGARAFLSRYRPTIYSELHPTKLQTTAGITREAYLDLVESLGYTTMLIEPKGQLASFDRSTLSDRLLNVVFEPRNTA